jgi:hypothetical protein
MKVEPIVHFVLFDTRPANLVPPAAAKASVNKGHKPKPKPQSPGTKNRLILT